MAVRLTPELRVLLVCAHVTLSDEQKHTGASLLHEPLDIELVYQQASTLGVGPLLYCGLLQIGDKSAPITALMVRLAQQMTDAAALYEFVYPQQLASLVSALAAVRIDVIVLKGYALGVRAYQQPALRQYSDFDLLVREADLRRAAKLLVELGYAPDENEHPLQWYDEVHHHMVPYMRAGALHVELHRTLTNAEHHLRIDYNDLWARAEPLSIGEAHAWMLSPEYQLLHLCIHAVYVHRVAEIGLRPLWDIYELVVNNTESLDWKCVVEASAAWGVGKKAHLMLRLVNTLFGDVVPAETLEAMSRDPLDEELLDYAIMSMAAGAFPGLSQSSGLAEAWQHQGVAHRSGAILRRLFPSRRAIAEHYGFAADDWRISLQYPRWITTMVRRHLVPGLRLLKCDTATLAAARQEASRKRLMGWLNGG